MSTKQAFQTHLWLFVCPISTWLCSQEALFTSQSGLTISREGPASGLSDQLTGLESKASLDAFHYLDNLLCSASPFKVLEIMKGEEASSHLGPKEPEVQMALPLPPPAFKASGAQWQTCQLALFSGSQKPGAQGQMACSTQSCSLLAKLTPSSNYFTVCYLFKPPQATLEIYRCCVSS